MYELMRPWTRQQNRRHVPVPFSVTLLKINDPKSFCNDAIDKSL